MKCTRKNTPNSFPNPRQSGLFTPTIQFIQLVFTIVKFTLTSDVSTILGKHKSGLRSFISNAQWCIPIKGLPNWSKMQECLAPKKCVFCKEG